MSPAYWALLGGWLSGLELGQSLEAGPRRWPAALAVPAIAVVAGTFWQLPSLGAWPLWGAALGAILVWAALTRIAGAPPVTVAATWAAPLEALGTVLSLGFFLSDWTAIAAGGAAGFASAWALGNRWRADGLFPVLWGSLGSALLWRSAQGQPWLGGHFSLWWLVPWLLAGELRFILAGRATASGPARRR